MKDAKKMTVFYTDDDIEDIEFFKEDAATLPEQPALVTHNNGRTLLEALHNPPPTPNMVFLDLNMPGVNGFEVLRQLRNDAKLKTLPVIIFSTSKDESTIARSMDLGASYFLPKSSSFSALQKSIAHALSIDWDSFKPNKDNFVYANI